MQIFFKFVIQWVSSDSKCQTLVLVHFWEDDQYFPSTLSVAIGDLYPKIDRTECRNTDISVYPIILDIQCKRKVCLCYYIESIIKSTV